MSVEHYKQELLQLQQKDYAAFVQAMISIEYQIDNPVCLSECYESFMAQDGMTLLHPDFETCIQRQMDI